MIIIKSNYPVEDIQAYKSNLPVTLSFWGLAVISERTDSELLSKCKCGTRKVEDVICKDEGRRKKTPFNCNLGEN